LPGLHQLCHPTVCHKPQEPSTVPHRFLENKTHVCGHLLVAPLYSDFFHENSV
jgi:hypothetical protein